MAETRFFDKARNWVVSRAGGAFQNVFVGRTDRRTVLPTPTAAGTGNEGRGEGGAGRGGTETAEEAEWAELSAELSAVEQKYLRMPRYRNALAESQASRPGRARL
jgi:hypothetical protein